MTENLGKAIREARFKRNMTQEELAKMLCVSQSKLSRIEKDQVELDPDLKKDILQFIQENGTDMIGQREIDYVHSSKADECIVQGEASTPAVKMIPNQKTGVLAFDLKTDFGHFFYFFLIVLSFITMDIGPLFAWYAVYYSISHKYHKAIIIVNILWAIVLTLMVINLYYFTIFPVDIKVMDVS